jgi:hypothetical protein
LRWDDGNSTTRIDPTAIHSADDPNLTVEDVNDPPGQTGPAVAWPVGYRGVRLAGGEVAVVDPADNLVAITGRRYSLKLSVGAVGAYALGNAAPPGWIDTFNACGDVGSVIPK